MWSALKQYWKLEVRLFSEDTLYSDWYGFYSMTVPKTFFAMVNILSIMSVSIFGIFAKTTLLCRLAFVFVLLDTLATSFFYMMVYADELFGISNAIALEIIYYTAFPSLATKLLLVIVLAVLAATIFWKKAKQSSFCSIAVLIYASTKLAEFLRDLVYLTAG